LADIETIITQGKELVKTAMAGLCLSMVMIKGKLFEIFSKSKVLADSNYSRLWWQ
jgi:hypothetical protein